MRDPRERVPPRRSLLFHRLFHGLFHRPYRRAARKRESESRGPARAHAHRPGARKQLGICGGRAPHHPFSKENKTLSSTRVECCFFPKVVLFFPIRIHVHSYACVCIHMHFIVFCMHSDALHSTNRLHSNAFCNHFELLHSSDARRLHSDAFSYLLHSRHVTF